MTLLCPCLTVVFVETVLGGIKSASDRYLSELRVLPQGEIVVKGFLVVTPVKLPRASREEM